jgi:hypothetical protein
LTRYIHVPYRHFVPSTRLPSGVSAANESDRPSQGFVLTARHVPQAFNREGQIHNPASLAGWVKHSQSKARFQYTIQPSLRSFGLAGRQSLNLGPGR